MVSEFGWLYWYSEGMSEQELPSDLNDEVKSQNNILGDEIPSGLTEMTIGTVGGFDYGEGVVDIFALSQGNTFTNPKGVEIANVDRFGFGAENDGEADRARKRIDDILEKNPLQEVKMRQGGLTEATMFIASELVNRGVGVTFERYNRDTGGYEAYYRIKRPEEESGDLESAGKDEVEVVSIHRHNYPKSINKALFSGVSFESSEVANLGLVQRDFYPNQVESFIFGSETDEVEKDETRGRGVVVNVATAPEQTWARIHGFMEAFPDLKRVKLYYSGLTEVTVIAAFELVKAGVEVDLVGHDAKEDKYKETVKLEKRKLETELVDRD